MKKLNQFATLTLLGMTLSCGAVFADLDVNVEQSNLPPTPVEEPKNELPAPEAPKEAPVIPPQLALDADSTEQPAPQEELPPTGKEGQPQELAESGHPAPQQETQPAPQPAPQAPAHPDEPQNMKASAEAADAWLKLLDEGKFAESWDAASKIFKMTLNKNEWILFSDNIRKPLGSLKERKVGAQDAAYNPKGLPEGEYMVIAYRTGFSNSDAKELLTLVRESDGQWRILTYQVSAGK